MSIIDDILDKRVDEVRILASERKMDEELFALLDKKGISKTDEMTDVIFEASSYGQHYGFHVGFKTAMSLLLECLTSW